MFGDGAAQRSLREARQLYDEGRYLEALPRLQYLVTKYPGTEESHEARYLLGLTFYEVEDYRDAIDTLHSYLELAPDGPHAEQAREAVTRLTQEYRQRYPSAEELDNRITSLQNSIEAEPTDPSLKMELADALWKSGRFDQSGDLYAEVARDFPGYRDDGVLRERIELHGDGGYTVLSPAEVRRREIARNPLLIFNTTSFQSWRTTFTQVPRFYVVAGQVMNRSESVLYGCAVHITIYEFGNRVLDARTYNIGALNPGEIRAFSVRFANFEDINSVGRYEVEGTFQR